MWTFLDCLIVKQGCWSESLNLQDDLAECRQGYGVYNNAQLRDSCLWEIWSLSVWNPPVYYFSSDLERFDCCAGVEEIQSGQNQFGKVELYTAREGCTRQSALTFCSQQEASEDGISCMSHLRAMDPILFMLASSEHQGECWVFGEDRSVQNLQTGRKAE